MGPPLSHQDLLPDCRTAGGSLLKMDYESLKGQWSEIEDRDGVRLSWNTFPSSRMVGCASNIEYDGKLTSVLYRKHHGLSVRILMPLY